MNLHVVFFSLVASINIPLYKYKLFSALVNCFTVLMTTDRFFKLPTSNSASKNIKKWASHSAQLTKSGCTAEISGTFAVSFSSSIVVKFAILVLKVFISLRLNSSYIFVCKIKLFSINFCVMRCLNLFLGVFNYPGLCI